MRVELGQIDEGIVVIQSRAQKERSSYHFEGGGERRTGISVKPTVGMTGCRSPVSMPARSLHAWSVSTCSTPYIGGRYQRPSSA